MPAYANCIHIAKQEEWVDAGRAAIIIAGKGTNVSAYAGSCVIAKKGSQIWVFHGCVIHAYKGSEVHRGNSKITISNTNYIVIKP
jgi:Fe-S cluster assembly scaffold protein SufB